MLILVRTLHILAAIWFCCGVAGYLATRLAMVRSEDVRGVSALVALMGKFRNLMIRPGGGLLLIFGLVTAYYEAWPEFSIHALMLLIIFIPFMGMMATGSHKIEAAAGEALKSDSVTPELKAAMRARKLLIGEYATAVITLLFLLIMLLK